MKHHLIASLTIVVLLITGCNFGVQEVVTPTPNAPVEETIIPTADMTNTPAPTATSAPTTTPTITPTLEPTWTPEPTLAIPTATPPPTETPAPTEVLGPWEHLVQQNEQLISIIQIYGYRTMDVIPLIVSMNDNMFNADFLPVGEVILIPRPTAAASVEQEAMPESTAVQSTGGQAGVPTIETRSNYYIPSGYQLHPYQVQGGDTVIGIVGRTPGLTLALFNQYNKAISFAGCNFELPGGSANCNPFLVEGMWVNILTPEPPPTATPTFIGNETATPTPTVIAPPMVSPPNGGLASGSVRLSWLSIGILQDQQLYVVTVRNLTTGSIWIDGTLRPNILLPSELMPPAGEEHTIEWSVTVGMRSETGDFYHTGGQGAPSHFTWRGQ